jgi:hypothetical protein
MSVGESGVFSLNGVDFQGKVFARKCGEKEKDLAK